MARPQEQAFPCTFHSSQAYTCVLNCSLAFTFTLQRVHTVLPCVQGNYVKAIVACRGASQGHCAPVCVSHARAV